MRAGPIVREATIRKPGMRRQVVTATVIVAAILVLLVVAYLVFLPKPERFSLSSYTWSEVKRADLAETVEGSGSVELAEVGQIIAPEPGYVASISVAPGAAVGKANILLKVVPQALGESLDEETASLDRQSRGLEELRLLRELEMEGEANRAAALEKELGEAKATLAKTEELRSSGFARENEVSDARKAAEAAQSALEDARSTARISAIRFEYAGKDAEAEIALLRGRIAKLRARIDACTIRSPVVGVVLGLAVTPGEFVSQYAPLASIGDYSRPPVIRLGVPQNVQQRVRPGQQVTITLAGKRYAGTVESKGMVAEQSASGGTNTVEVKVAFLERPEDLVPGSSAAVAIQVGIKPAALSLPRGPYLTTGGGLVLYRIEGEKAHRADVAVGVVTSLSVEILKGVEEGERIITSSYQDYLIYKEIALVPGGGVKSDTTREAK